MENRRFILGLILILVAIFRLPNHIYFITEDGFDLYEFVMCVLGVFYLFVGVRLVLKTI